MPCKFQSLIGILVDWKSLEEARDRIAELVSIPDRDFS